MYSAVVFDFFGVFCTPLATNWFKKTVSTDKTDLEAFQAICTRSDYGKLSRADFNTEVSKLTGVPIPAIVEGIEAETHINTSLVAYTQGLKAKGYRIACLSNGTREWTLRVVIDHGLGDLFEEVILSGDIGIVKPSPEIYSHTLTTLGATASQVIFVDDRKANVTAAEACGMRGVVFTDTPAFITELESLLGQAA
jgi:HAD superfamily hydrolase (TIGR01509 family)